MNPERWETPARPRGPSSATVTGIVDRCNATRCGEDQVNSPCLPWVLTLLETYRIADFTRFPHILGNPVQQECSCSPKRTVLRTEFAGDGGRTATDDFVKAPDQGTATVLLKAGEGEKSCECRSGFPGDQVLDLAGVGFGNIGVHTEDIDQEGENDASFRENAGHDFFTRAAEPETVVLSDINQPVVLQCPQLN